MLLRKSRQHHHGSSNKNLTKTHLQYSNNQIISSKPHLDLPKKQMFTSALKKRIKIKKEYIKTEQDQSKEQKNKIQSNYIINKIRDFYHDKRSVVKLVDEWGFDSKGYITRQTFKRYLQVKTNKNIPDRQIQEVFKCLGIQNDCMNVQEFLTLVHGKIEGMVFNQTLFNPKEFSSVRNRKIQNLKQTLKNFTKAQKTQKTQEYLNNLTTKINFSLKKMNYSTRPQYINYTKEQLFKQIEKYNNFNTFDRQNLKIIQKQINFNEMKYLLQCNRHIDNLLLDTILRRTNKKDTANYNQGEGPNNEENYSKIMMKTMNNFSYFVRKQDKVVNFDPKSMSNVNQQKTRFGNSNFTRSSQNFYPQIIRQNFKPNQKQLVIQTLNCEQSLKKQRYENKLQRLRNYMRIQKQNIAKREDAVQQRDKQRMERISFEQQAYNYVNFIKKKWQ